MPLICFNCWAATHLPPPGERPIIPVFSPVVIGDCSTCRSYDRPCYDIAPPTESGKCPIHNLKLDLDNRCLACHCDPTAAALAPLVIECG